MTSNRRHQTARRHNPSNERIKRQCVVYMKEAEHQSESEIERRNRALIAFTLLTGARDSAIASTKLKHIGLTAGSAYQDAREVRTRFSKTCTTFFFPVGGDIRRIVADWVMYLRKEKLWRNDDPLFPATQVTVGAARKFEPDGLPYFNPHSFRNTLARLGGPVCRTPEDFKASSQNLGNEDVLTTFRFYGNVPDRRQGEIMRGLASQRDAAQHNMKELAEAIAHELRGPKRETSSRFPVESNGSCR